MKVVRSWLREFCPTDLSAEELGELLSAKGAHLEKIERPWEGLEGVTIARVIEVRDHPYSDRLCLARVQTGSGEQEVVVGVRNMGPGDLVPLAPPGARVPSLPDAIGAREVRGVVSNGMLCSPRELAISGDHEGILVLHESGLEVGKDLKEALGLDEVVLELEIESNRSDLLSIAGIAREVAGALRLPLTLPDVSFVESDEESATAATVEVKDAEGCPRYLARVIQDVGDRSTPTRVQARLSASGARPISPAVDATNYAMLELGQPLHAFDLRRLAGPGIVVRRAETGERLTTLDGLDRDLTEQDLLICDVERPVAIAGVMGGATSEVSASTRDVLLESAYFEPRGILRTSRRLQLLTEASIRFSRGADPEGVGLAAARASQLMLEWAGGEVLAGAIDVGAFPPRRTIAVRPSRASALIGYGVDASAVVEALGRIGIVAEAANGDVRAEIPSFRPDIKEEVDLIEEVVRVQGYERLPATLPGVRQAGGEQASYTLRRRVRDLLVRAGLQEASSLSFASPADLELMGHTDPIVVTNPPSAEEPFLRTSLIPNLLKAIDRNVARGARSVALFEVGHVFRAGDPVDEREFAAGVLFGKAVVGVNAGSADFDVFDAKGAVEVLLTGLGVDGWSLGEPASAPFHAGRSAGIVAGGASIGMVGELHPRAAERFGLAPRVAVFELDVGALTAIVDGSKGFRDVPRFPPVRRDLAFVVPEDTPAGAVQAALEEGGGDLLDTCELFDVFRGGSLPAGTKSLAFSVDFRSPNRTLTDEEAEEAVSRIVDRIGQDFGGELRSG